MQCPNCQADFLESIEVCEVCKTNYTNAEIIELFQLKFLLGESLNWPDFSQQRAVYLQRWRELQLRRPETIPVVVEDTEALVPVDELCSIKETKLTTPTLEPNDRASLTFGETAIRLALYAGGFLLVLAGLIFIGATWSHLPTAVKLLVTLSITGVMYGSGILLFWKPTLRIGGLALVTVASGFFPMNLAVLHIYWLDGLGVSTQITWFVGSVVCLFIYLGTALYTRGHVFTYLSILASLSAVTAFLSLDSPFSYVLIYTLVPLPWLFTARFSHFVSDESYLYWPGVFTSAALLLILFPCMIGIAVSSPEIWFITLLLAAIAVLYGLMAVITGWEVLLLVSLLGANLLLVSGWRLLDSFTFTPVTLSFAFLGIFLYICAVSLQFVGWLRWAWPFYVFALFDLAGSYLIGLFIEQPWPIFLSFTFAILALGTTWVQQPFIEKYKSPPLTTYGGLLLIFIGYFYVLDYLSAESNDTWPVYSAILCSLFLLASWPFSYGSFEKLYGGPLRWTGVGLMIVPLWGILITLNEVVGLVTFIILGVALILDGIARRWIYHVYLGTGAFIGALWCVLVWIKVEQIQAYVVPFGLWLIVVGWYEYLRRQPVIYILLNLAGLGVILGPTFIQSIDSGGYAVLMFFESLLVLSMGLGIRSRSYVLVGLASLTLNGLVQFQPAFAELPRFVQIGSIGTLLLGGGLVALLQREQFINFGRSMRLQWHKWGP